MIIHYLKSLLLVLNHILRMIVIPAMLEHGHVVLVIVVVVVVSIFVILLIKENSYV